MLTEERHQKIMEIVNWKGSVKISDLCEYLAISVSTARRDIQTLDEMGKLTKVHGGAVALNEKYFPTEANVEEKAALFAYEKEQIAKYAAGLVEDGDLRFIFPEDRFA